MKTAPPSKRRTKTAKNKPASSRRSGKTPASDIIEMVPRLLSIQRILVPLDFSESSKKALRYATSFARQFDAKITLLHVHPLPYYPADMGGIPVITPVNEPSLDKIKKHLDAEGRRLLPPEMSERTVLRIGVAHDEICEAARDFAVDLIILATHGYTGLKHTFLGSTAERVVRHAPCPVLVVRQHEHEFA
jgi:nucleotide-binding universal stress UspA family protein